jgi:Mycothiol maleylpyruvate isomerase N-terminal domain
VAPDDPSHRVLARIAERTADIVTALLELDEVGLNNPSELPDWSRLTIACHLRYGAEALVTMTEATLQGRTASFYPEGRARQRAGTLLPSARENAPDVVRSLAEHSARLDQAWSMLRAESWHLEVTEPTDNADLGRIPLSRLALLRLTEVEVHGSDLGLQLGEWSTTFIDTALPMRLEGLTTRTPIARTLDALGGGAWLLVASDGPTYRVSVSEGVVAATPTTSDSRARAILEATSRDLLALLLGRPLHQELRITGDRAFGEAFSAAFPGP